MKVCNIFLFANEIALKKFQWDATNQAIKNEYKTVYQIPSLILEVYLSCRYIRIATKHLI